MLYRNNEIIRRGRQNGARKTKQSFPRKRFGGTSDGYVSRRWPWACARTPEKPFRQGLSTTPVDH